MTERSWLNLNGEGVKAARSRAGRLDPLAVQ